jgi:hypothetical protein
LVDPSSKWYGWMKRDEEGMVQVRDLFSNKVN